MCRWCVSLILVYIISLSPRLPGWQERKKEKGKKGAKKRENNKKIRKRHNFINFQCPVRRVHEHTLRTSRPHFANVVGEHSARPAAMGAARGVVVPFSTTLLCNTFA